MPPHYCHATRVRAPRGVPPCDLSCWPFWRAPQVFEEEAITDVSLLTSMGEEMLRENLEELGLEPSAVDLLASDLFPGGGGGDDDDDDVLELEDNADAEVVPSGGTPANAAATGAAVPVDALPDDLTQEEVDAAEAEAQWLLNPLSMMDLSDTKDRLIKLMREGVAFQQKGHFANARAVYTRAIGMEAPNKRMNAALYYNRASCQRSLGQLALALRDAQKAYEIDPNMTKAHWRAADVAIIMDDMESAREAVDAGLKVSPRCQPLLQCKLRITRFG